MNYLIINGSPRRVNTWEIVKNVKNKLSILDDNVEFNEINLKDLELPLCDGCFNCFTRGEEYCPHNNIIQSIVKLMKECDGIIITSPVYALNVTGLIKNFIDHLAYFYHRPCFFNKKALVIVTTAGNGHKKVGNYLDETLRNWGYNERFKLCFIYHKSDSNLPEKIISKVDDSTTRFYNSIKSNKLKSPSLKALFMYNLWRAMASNKKIELDYDYWKNNNMLDSVYYPSVKCNTLKGLPFKLMYSIFKGILK